MAAPFTVAQLMVPDDGLTNVGSMGVWIVPDWPRGRLYIVTGGYIRTYTTEKATQTPLSSVAITNLSATTGIHIYADPGLDPQSGDILCLGNPNGTSGPSNTMLTFRVSPTTGLVTGHYGTMSSLGSYPSGVWVPESLVGVVCGPLSYAICKEDAFSGEVCLIRASSPMNHAGHENYIVSNNRNNRANLAAGASGVDGASAFLIDTNNPGQTTVNVYYCRIAPGAESYSPLSWPTPNPFVTSGVLGTLSTADINPAWTQLVGRMVVFDQTDGNVIASVDDNGPSAHQRVVKLNAATGTTLWVTEVTTHSQNLMASRITGGWMWLLGGNLHVSTLIETATGATTQVPLTGLDFSYPTVAYDGAGLAVFRGTYAAPGASGSGTSPADPAPGTTSFSGYGLIWPTDGPPGPPAVTTLTDAELVFQPQIGFTDFTDETVRRLFVSTGGTPAWMEPDGGLPFGMTPAVYLTTLGPPTDFAQNNGSGGAFAPSGTIDAATGPGCTPYFFVEAAGPEANPQWRLTVSDDGGRTWSRLVKPRSIGALGKYLTRLRWLKMGQSRERVVKLECTDRVRNNIVGIYIDLDQGMG